MNTFNAFPFYRLLVFLVLGLLFRFLLSTFVSPLFIIFLFLLCILFVSLSVFCKKSFEYRWIRGVGIFVFLFTAGFFLKPFFRFSPDIYQKSNFYNADIIRIVKTSENKQTLLLDCRGEKSDLNLHFRVIGYNDTCKSGRYLYPGDHIYIHSKIQKFKLDNPYIFNYGNYLFKRDIIGFINLIKSDFVFQNHTFSFQSIFYHIKERARSKLKKLHIGNEEYSILTALILGDKSLLDRQTRTEFSDAGAIHLLAVSGLHVGIIYIFLSFILKGLDRKGWRGLRLSIILSCLWFYALTTGLSPSVLRATIMFSLFLVSGYLNHSYQVYHAMAISAFIILVIDPYSLINIGFWLSFLAVASIVYFYPILYGRFCFSKPWNKYLWSLVSVSCAVQIGTAPLVIYLFGFFPTWFLISNILVVPVVSFIFGSALFCTLLPVDTIVFKMLEAVIADGLKYCEICVRWIVHFPYAHFIKVQFGSLELVFFYLSLFFFMVWRMKKKYKLLFVSVFSFVVFLSVNLILNYRIYNSTTFIVYNSRNHSFISVVKGGEKADIYMDDLCNRDIDYFIPPLLAHFEVSATNIHDIAKRKIVGFLDSGKKVLLINDNLDEKDLFGVLQKANVVIFTEAVSNCNVLSIIYKNKKKQFVFDTSNSKFRCKQIKKKLHNEYGNIHYVSLDGAFVYEDGTDNITNWLNNLY